MNYILNSGEVTVYENDVIQHFTKLPVGMYRVNFDKLSGWSLATEQDIKIEEQIYGDHKRKAQKVIDVFEVFPRNLGVLLSGNKGMGKSLVCKLICNGMLEKGYPIIVVDKYIPGMSAFLHKIDTECVIFLDEFDKLFFQPEEYDCGERPQDEMLSLFDGLDTNKKLFLVTCNKLCDISSYMLNRPGRFHYHFRFTYPTDEEIEEYLYDNVNEKYHDEIVNVVAFSKKVRLNYDCLRSIAFELNLGQSFYDFIDDLNIIKIGKEAFKVFAEDTDGNLYVGEEYIDMFDDVQEYINLYGKDDLVHINIIPSKFEYDSETGMHLPVDDKAFSQHEEDKVRIKSIKIKSNEGNTFSFFE